MFEHVLAVTCRALCPDALPEQLARVAAAHPAGILLREKDLSEAAYETLSAEALRICRAENVPCILHTHAAVARRLGCGAIHLPLSVLAADSACAHGFSTVGASVHSVGEAETAVRLGATYLTAGHVFPTDCKAGVPARGLDFLRAVCAAVPVPVYAIGGITPQNAAACMAAGAAGVAVMSGCMRGPISPEWFAKSVHS